MSLPGIKEPIENVLPNILGRLGKENPSQRQRKGCLCTAQVRCDVVSFGTISIRYVQESSITIIANNHFHYCRQHAQMGMAMNSFTFIQEHGVISTLTSRHTTLFFKKEYWATEHHRVYAHAGCEWNMLILWVFSGYSSQ